LFAESGDANDDDDDDGGDPDTAAATAETETTGTPEAEVREAGEEDDDAVTEEESEMPGAIDGGASEEEDEDGAAGPADAIEGREEDATEETAVADADDVAVAVASDGDAVDGPVGEENDEEDSAAGDDETDAVEADTTSDGEAVAVEAPEEEIAEGKSEPFFAAPKDRITETVQGVDLELISNVVGEIAGDLLSVLRFRTANLLTSTLPEDQRDELLRRMGATAMTLPSSDKDDGGGDDATAEAIAEEMVLQTRDDDDEDEAEVRRASIQEEIAVARAEESQKSEKRWEREKEGILREMERAANARVDNELKIQKMKLEEERVRAVRETEAVLEAERERLERAVSDERARADALAESAAAAAADATPGADPNEEIYDVDDLFAVRKDEELARNKELEALLEEREEQQTALDEIEEELLASVANEEEQRDRLRAALEKRQFQQGELDAVETDLKKQVQRVESEKVRYEQLVADLETVKAKERRLREEVEEEGAAEDESPSSAIEADENENENEIAAETEDGEEDPEHPVLGPVIADLGYKRIHLVSSGRLGTIPIWNRNRIYRNNRAKAMATEKLKTMELGFPGVIGLHEAPSGKLSIVDGQHRVGMMASLKERINKKFGKGDEKWKEATTAFQNVLVEVYPEPVPDEGATPKSEDDGFAERIFVEINKAEPVKLIDMPGVASAADRKIISEACENLQEQYADMFSASQRCRVPNMNLDNLRSMIFGADLLRKHKLTTGKKLTDWLLVKNAAVGIEYESDLKKQELFSKKQWDKASSNNFYLGLETSWLYK